MNPSDASGISRRSLLTGLGAAAVAGAAPNAFALPQSEAPGWAGATDVLVIGSGAAGISAALEARQAGAKVLVMESLGQFGGSSAMSGGVIYAGGGTALQKALGVEDSAEQMARFLALAGGPHPPVDKISRYCEESPAHFDWLVEQDVPYTRKITLAKGLPMGDESLYFSGNEQAWPSRDLAEPAPRGHVPGIAGMNGGRSLMQALLQKARKAGVALQANASLQQLIVASDGRVVGATIQVDGRIRAIRAVRGVVLASGGFIHNRPMVRQYAPQLYDCSVPWGNAGDLGQGILAGMAVGGAVLRMHHGFAIAPLYPPEQVLAGIVVNAAGQRFISEESYHGVLGDAIAFHQQGKAWLITDKDSSYSTPQDNFLPVATASTVGDLAAQLQLPRGALQNTVGYYNRYAANGEDPMFQKEQTWLRPLQKPPFTAWNLSVDSAFFPAHTFGGLQTSVEGAVINSFGDAIAGLYAAGRTTAGLPMAPYIASGLSVGDCTFFGRLAGKAVAGSRA